MSAPTTAIDIAQLQQQHDTLRVANSTHLQSFLRNEIYTEYHQAGQSVSYSSDDDGSDKVSRDEHRYAVDIEQLIGSWQCRSTDHITPELRVDRGSDAHVQLAELAIDPLPSPTASTKLKFFERLKKKQSPPSAAATSPPTSPANGTASYDSNTTQPCTLLLTTHALYVLPPAIQIEVINDQLSQAAADVAPQYEYFLVYHTYKRFAIQDILNIYLPYVSDSNEVDEHGNEIAVRLSDVCVVMRDLHTVCWVNHLADRYEWSELVNTLYTASMQCSIDLLQCDYVLLLDDICQYLQLYGRIFSNERPAYWRSMQANSTLHTGILQLTYQSIKTELAPDNPLESPQYKTNPVSCTAVDWHDKYVVVTADHFVLLLDSAEHYQKYIQNGGNSATALTVIDLHVCDLLIPPDRDNEFQLVTKRVYGAATTDGSNAYTVQHVYCFCQQHTFDNTRLAAKYHKAALPKPPIPKRNDKPSDTPSSPRATPSASPSTPSIAAEKSSSPHSSPLVPVARFQYSRRNASLISQYQYIDRCEYKQTMSPAMKRWLAVLVSSGCRVVA